MCADCFVCVQEPDETAFAFWTSPEGVAAAGHFATKGLPEAKHFLESLGVMMMMMMQVSSH
jgi:hypothetical protein